MLIIPELEKVVILVPRTGTSALYRAALATYPKAFMPYRHMEADGVPFGYDRWEKVGVCRHPVARMWSLWNFMKTMKADHTFTQDGRSAPDYIARIHKQATRPFEDWLLNNEENFNSGYDSSWGGKYYPNYAVRHVMPENRKSQFIHLRPDLGTRIVTYDRVRALWGELKLPWRTENLSYAPDPPKLSQEAERYVAQVFAWDLKAWRS